VGLAGVAASPPAGVPSVAGFSFSVATAPPVAPVVGGVAALEELSSVAGAVVFDDELSLVFAVDFVVVEVDVELVCADAASAVVFVGGVISGVLLGTASETLLPPHALSATPQSSTVNAASATRAFTVVPYACRTWGSR
jgi:hypothetical protein